MFFSLGELVQWLGLTVFEIWINLVALTVFSVLLALRVEGVLTSSNGWWIVFSPLFTADGLNAYFCTIVYIRMHLEGMYKAALLRAAWSSLFLVLSFVFKFLLCNKLAGQNGLEYSEVLSPVFILLQLIAVRACQLH
ncbi:transmembrane protein 203 isoform X2 [Anabrus simplex]|uniref:transmembrane protein 203 isoform X2 n=1 Tax=Anabrus simplex TaxID=316456 RepID=UPI0034DD6931